MIKYFVPKCFYFLNPLLLSYTFIHIYAYAYSAWLIPHSYTHWQSISVIFQGHSPCFTLLIYSSQCLVYCKYM